MRSKLLLVLAVVFIGVAAWFVLNDQTPVDDYEDGEFSATDSDDDAEDDGVLLEGDEEAAKRNADRRAREKAQKETDARERADELARSTPQTLVEGRVVADQSDKPIPGTVIRFEDAAEPCDRLPGNADTIQFGAISINAQVQASADGRFQIEIPGHANLNDQQGKYDVFITAPGYVGQSVCRVPNGRAIEVRLKKGHTMDGVVRDVLQRPVVGASITATPVDGVPSTLGHFAEAVTDAQGRFELTGLLPGAVSVHVAHSKYMPKRVGPVDPTQATPVQVVLAAALLVTLELETVGREEPKNASYSWTTSGQPATTGLALLQPGRIKQAGAQPANVNVAPILWEKNADGRYPTRTFPVPCVHKEFTLAVKTEGHATWKSESMLLPPEGGERTIRVPLLADDSKGKALVRFERDGETVPYSSLRAYAAIATDQKVEGGLVMHAADEFKLSGMPPGKYTVTFYSRDAAPAVAEFAAVEGEEAEAMVVLRPPAKLRVRFTAAEPLTVSFQIHKDNRLVRAFLAEGDAADEPDPEEGGAPKAESSENGTLFSGLASGEHVIIISDPKLKASRTRVTLTEGQEAEIEIRVETR